VVAGIVVLFTILARVVMVERRVSRGYSELQRAEMAAQAGAADANNLLLYLFQNFPDSATYWEPKVANAATPGTVFMFRDKAPNDAAITYDGSGYATNVKTFARPLMSGAVTKEFYPSNQFTQTLVAAAITDHALSVDLNEPEQYGGGDENGWIGAMPGATPVPIRVPWVEVLEDPSAPKSPTNRAVARYAWWADDESFKLNVNTAKAALRGNPDAETKLFAGKPEGNPQPSLQGLFANSASPQNVAESIEEARENLAATGGQFLSAAQVGHANTVPSDTTQLGFARDYKYLLTADSSGLNLSRTGAKRLNVNEVVGDGSDDPAEVKKAVEQIIAAINENAPQFGQRFFRLQTSSLSVPTISTTVATNKNRLDVPSTAYVPGISESFEDLYVRKIAVNIYDHISPKINPTVMDIQGNVWLGAPVYADEIFETMGPVEGDITEPNPLAAIGKKPVPYFTEYMINANLLNRNPASGAKPGANSIIGYADYELEIDHYFEFWNMSGEDIVPANGDLGPSPYMVLDNQPAISVNNKGKISAPPNTEVPAGRPFEIKLDEKFSLNGGADADLVFPAGSVTVITTDPNYAAHTAHTGLAGKTVYVAKTLYIPGTSTSCSDPGVVSTQPFQAGEGSGMVPNVLRYNITSFDSREDEGHEIQLGPDMIGSASVKIVLGNAEGLLDVHPGLSMGPQSSNMIVFKPGRVHQYRGSFIGGGAVGFYDPRGSMEAVDIRLVKVSLQSENHDFILNSSMTVLNGQNGDNQGVEQSNFGQLRLATGQTGNTDKISSVQGAENAPIVAGGAPIQSIGELGHVFDPLRPTATVASGNTLANIKRRRAGGRTLPIGQPDTLWDGTRVSSLSSLSDEMRYQSSRSRNWTAWRLADILTTQRDENMRGDNANSANRTEVAGLYNPNGILRDEGRVLRTLVEGIQFGNAQKSDPTLAGTIFSSTDTDDILPESSRASISAAQAGSGGKALANFLAQRLTRSVPKRFSPLWEPGELSQLDFFAYKLGNYSATGSGGTTAPFIRTGINNDTLNDRGLEEIFKRLVDLITPKGNTYTIYVVGQSLDRQGKPTATKAQRITVRLRPVYNSVLKADFDPASEAADRFRAPDSYALHVIKIEEA